MGSARMPKGEREGRDRAKRDSRPAGKAGRGAGPTVRPTGWSTSDEEQIVVRRERAETEPMEVRAVGADGFYGAFSVSSSGSGRTYPVEIRSLEERENSCSCSDFRNNGLGTCKHVEAVLVRLRRKGAAAWAGAAAAGTPFVEVYLDRKGDPRVRVAWPRSEQAEVREFLGPYFGSDGVLLADPCEAVPSLTRAIEQGSPAVRRGVRVSRDVCEWAGDMRRRRDRERARDSFLRDVEEGKRSASVVKADLYPYQRDGMLHLAFGERAMLADEMGLGKTVQAIAACELLRQLRGVERVLVVSPASLKAEWEEQIAKFTALPTRIVWGPRAARMRLYREPSFFYLCNYEQAREDCDDINAIVAPDVVILDEAQRIKNWQTKTARRIKRLASPFAFVLTGTPLENRIDEVYSIVEFLDPSVFGPLFRFNREFYVLDERGRPVGLKNLAELHRRLRPVMLRRRKDEVEDQLPGRTVNNYFVAMAPEQREPYGEYEDKVARLVATAKRRPLTQDEYDRLQRWLACMRMICDTPYILDQDCRVCPKLDELAAVLDDVLGNDGSKAIVFSEWERMLELAREMASGMKIDHAWHTGSVPQQRRRAEINRFKQDPACRLFLSTDAGATGLNLQVANVVVNLDLPWNPARLEQRIARAWRKHQTRPVTVINLVSEDSIEHRMLATLADKQQLADGVLDARGDLEKIRMPGGRQVFMERLQSLVGGPAAAMAPPARPEAKAWRGDPARAFCQDLVARLSSRLLLLETRPASEGRTASLLAVVDGPLEQARPMAERLFRQNYAAGEPTPRLEVLDRATYEAIQRLVEGGVLKIEGAMPSVLHREPTLPDAARKEQERRRTLARPLLDLAERKLQMGNLLCANGFVAEAMAPVRDAVELALRAAGLASGSVSVPEGEPIPLSLVEGRFRAEEWVPAGTPGMVARLRQPGGGSATVTGEAVVEAAAFALAMVRHVHATVAGMSAR